MNPRIHTWMFMILLACAIASRSVADGGQVIATATLGQEHAVMMVNPSMPRVGLVAVIVRVSSGLEPFECTLTAHSQLDAPPIQCILGADPDGLGQRGLIECAEASVWTISARVSTALGVLQLQGELQVSPVPPNWQIQLPWIVLWLPFAMLLLLRQCARRRIIHYDDTRAVS